jgi:hypothetical protein
MQLATVTLEVVPFRSQRFYHFLNACCKLCSMRAFSTTRDSASSTSVVSKWRHFSLIFNQGNIVAGKKSGKKGGRGTTVMLFCVVMKYQPVSFVAKV